MSFRTECVPDVGLEYYISQAEALLGNDFVREGREARDILELRQKIWEHVKQAFITTSNSTKEGALKKVISAAAKQGFGIADIVSTDTEEIETPDFVQPPQKELDLLMKAQRKVKNRFVSELLKRAVDWYSNYFRARHQPKKITQTVKQYKLIAKLYSSDFLEGEGKDPIAEILNYLEAETPAQQPKENQAQSLSKEEVTPQPSAQEEKPSESQKTTEKPQDKPETPAKENQEQSPEKPYEAQASAKEETTLQPSKAENPQQKESGDRFYNILMKKILESAVKEGKNTGMALLDKELERRKEGRLAEIAGEEFNPKNYEHLTKVLEVYHYPRIAELGKPLKALTAEINQLEKDIDKLENEQTKIPTIAAPSGADRSADNAYLERDEKIKAKKAKVAEKKKEYGKIFTSKIGIAERQLDFLIGSNANPLRSPTYDVRDDYRRQNKTEESVRQKLAPLYINFHLTKDGIVRSDDGSLSDSEFKIIAQSIAYFKQKRGFMTPQGFSELIDYILQGLHQELLTTPGSDTFGNRYRNYSRLIDELGDRQHIAKAVHTPPHNQFDYLVHSILRYYMRNDITQEEAANSLLRLRYEEIADKIFEQTFSEFRRQLQEAGRKEPKQQELADVLDVAIEKTHALLRIKGGQPFVSVIETRYKQASNGIQRLAYEYNDLFVAGKSPASDTMELEFRYCLVPQPIIESYYLSKALLAEAAMKEAAKGKSK